MLHVLYSTICVSWTFLPVPAAVRNVGQNWLPRYNRCRDCPTSVYVCMKYAHYLSICVSCHPLIRGYQHTCCLRMICCSSRLISNLLANFTEMIVLGTVLIIQSRIYGEMLLMKWLPSYVCT